MIGMPNSKLETGIIDLLIACGKFYMSHVLICLRAELMALY